MRPTDAALRYDRVARWLHGGIGALMIGQIAFGLALDALAPRGSPGRADVINLHKSLGVLLLALVLLRLAWRWRHPPPPWPPTMQPAAVRAATWGHRWLYALMLALPLAGWLASNLSRHGLRVFGWRIPPWGPDVPLLYQTFNALHVALAWALALTIVGHVAMGLWHGVVRRDGVLQRMLPRWPRR